MNSVAVKPRMTTEAFFRWAQAQDIRYEFDGSQPVAMTVGTVNHSRITNNIHRALYARLRGTACEPLGPDAGLATIGDSVRYPDALVTCSKPAGEAHTIPGVIVVFEVLSPSSGGTDRIVKVREYHAVPSIRCYVILEHRSIGVTVLRRARAEDAWTATALTAGDILRMPEIGVEVPVAELYEAVDLSAYEAQDGGSVEVVLPG
jgi:Uma2 family endonuclease